MSLFGVVSSALVMRQDRSFKRSKEELHRKQASFGNQGYLFFQPVSRARYSVPDAHMCSFIMSFIEYTKSSCEAIMVKTSPNTCYVM